MTSTMTSTFMAYMSSALASLSLACETNQGVSVVRNSKLETENWTDKWKKERSTHQPVRWISRREGAQQQYISFVLCNAILKIELRLIGKTGIGWVCTLQDGSSAPMRLILTSSNLIWLSHLQHMLPLRIEGNR